MTGDRPSNRASEGVRPGALSALLQQLAAAPPAAEGAGGTGDGRTGSDAGDSGLRAGSVVGRFELVRELGRGGFGVVWEALDRELGRRIAFKVVRAGKQRDLREERLLREAEAAARLTHPNIVTLFDVGRSPHGPYLVLELLEGETLAERLTAGALPASEALRIATAVAMGLAHAHAQGVVHRDLKPENVFLCADGQVKVLDFGLAHAFGHRRLDGGTPAYMAPEQVEGAPEDERTDVFALGVILFEMLTGRRPFEDERALRSPVVAPALEVPDAPEVGALVARMLEKRPVERPREAGDVLAVLRSRGPDSGRALASTPVVVRKRLPGRRGPAVAVAALAVLAAAVGLWQVASRRSEARMPSRPDGRALVVVADFANETGEREMDALSGLFITALEQSRRLSVLPRGRLFDLARQAGRGDVARIDEVIGREVGRKAGARALLVTSVHRLGATYAVQLRALDPVKDEDLFSAREVVSSKDAMFGLIDRLAERARSELREGAAEARASETRSIGALTTSLHAYEHYFRGRELEDHYELAAAAAEYRKALEKDPQFALAHYGLSTALMEFGAPDEERRKHAVAAAKAADRLPERERLLVQAWHARSFWRFEEMGRLYRALVERYPDDKRSLVTAGSGLLMGLFDAESSQQAAEKALSLDRAYAPAYDILLGAHVLAERLDEALDQARRWERESHAVGASDWLVTVHLLRGEPDDALRVIGSALAFPGRSGRELGVLRLARAGVHLRRDDLEAAEADARAVPVDVFNRYTFAFRASLAVYGGRPQEAERLLATAPFEQSFLRGRFEALAGGGPSLALRAAARAMSGQSGTIDGVVAVVLALVGEVGLADEVSRRPNAHGTSPFVEAMRLRWTGDLAGARRALEALRHARPPVLRQAATYALGETCHAAGDDRCAIEALRAFRWMDDPMFQFESRAWAYPRSLLLLARSHERLGEREAALATVDHLLALWKHAEPDFAGVVEAKALRARLASSAVPSTVDSRR